MCGRYVLSAHRAEVTSTFQLNDCPAFEHRYNFAPLQYMPVIRQRPSGEQLAHLLRWGLLPAWAKYESMASKLINARVETLSEKPSLRAAYKARRGIVPASGFYEWQVLAGGKQPYYIQPSEGDVFGFAGLWERWNRSDGEPLDTFTIVTTQAVAEMGKIHER